MIDAIIAVYLVGVAAVALARLQNDELPPDWTRADVADSMIFALLAGSIWPLVAFICGSLLVFALAAGLAERWMGKTLK